MTLIRFLLLGAVVLAGSGCGASTETGPSASAGPEASVSRPERPRLSASALTTRANAVCSRRQRELAALPKPGPGVELADVMARVITIERREALGLLELRPPAAQEVAYARLVAASVELVKTTGRLRASLAAKGNGSRHAALAEAERVSRAYDRAAAELGLLCRQTVS
jgi:hypothetical protein